MGWLHGPPQAFSGQREIKYFFTQGRQRVGRGIEQRSRHADAAGLAHALSAQQVGTGVGTGAGGQAFELDQRHLVGARYGVVHQ